jgi:integrase
MAKEPKVKVGAKQAGSTLKATRLLPPQYIEKLQTWAWDELQVSGPHTRSAAMVLLLFGTAARRMELGAFKIKDIYEDFDGPVVCFRVAKGNKTGEIVPLTPETWKAYQLWLVWKRTHGESVEPNAPVFCGRPGEHMALVTIWRLWKQALELVGVPAANTYGVHAARHAAAYLILRATRDYSRVKRILRHESVATTEAFYEHFNLGDLRNAMEKAGL